MADLKLKFLFLLICCVNSVFCKFSSQQRNWSYTIKAFTFDGNECLSDCVYSQCVVNFKGEMRACYTTDDVPLVFYTSRFYDHFSTECKSNCGFFEHEYEACVTTNDIIDHCNSSPLIPTQRTVYNRTCHGPCTLDNVLNFYTCPTQTNIHQNCAPPASIRQNSKNAQTDDSKISVTEKPQNCPQVMEKPATQTCASSTEKSNENQCNCDCKNNAEYNKKDIYFKIEANIPHEMIDKVHGNQYHFTINFDSKTHGKVEGNSDKATEKPVSPKPGDNKEPIDQTTDAQDNLPSKKPDKNVSERPSNNNEGNEGSDEISPDMMRSNFSKE